MLFTNPVQVSKHKCAYFSSVWNWLDIIIIALSLTCAGFNIYRTIKVDQLLDSLLKNPNQFANFQLLSIWQVNFNYGVAVTVFLAWMKVSTYTHSPTNPHTHTHTLVMTSEYRHRLYQGFGIAMI